MASGRVRLGSGCGNSLEDHFVGKVTPLLWLQDGVERDGVAPATGGATSIICYPREGSARLETIYYNQSDIMHFSDQSSKRANAAVAQSDPTSLNKY